MSNGQEEMAGSLFAGDLTVWLEEILDSESITCEKQWRRPKVKYKNAWLSNRPMTDNCKTKLRKPGLCVVRGFDIVHLASMVVIVHLYVYSVIKDRYLFFFSSFSTAQSIWKFLNQGLNPSLSCDLHHSCGHAGSFTHCPGLGSQPAPLKRQHWIFNLLCLRGSSKDRYLYFDFHRAGSFGSERSK